MSVGRVDRYQRKAGSAGTKGGVDRSQAVQIVGLAQFRRELAKIDKDLGKEINKYLRVLAVEMRNEARSRAPVKTGALRKSIKHGVRAKELSLYSNLPYAPAHEWGAAGTPNSQVQPKGVPIRIKRTQMLGGAVFENQDKIEKHLLGLVDHLARINGFDD